MSDHTTKLYLAKEHPFAYAAVTNFGKGKALLQIHSDWGTYSHYWGSMGGDQTGEQFLANASESYIESKLTFQMNYMGCKKEAYARLTKFMAQCWPRLKQMFKEAPSANEGKEG